MPYSQTVDTVEIPTESTGTTNPTVKILAINLYYAPDIASSGQLLAELCEGLSALGNSVAVVTGQPSYISSSPTSPEFEILNGVEVHRVSMGRHVGRNSMWTRLVGYTKFMYRARKMANRVATEFSPDVFFRFRTLLLLD